MQSLDAVAEHARCTRPTVWCRSVAASWTLELHQLAGGAAPVTIVDWISSGVPISHPVPDALACELLAERGLRLFGDFVRWPVYS